MMRKFLWLGWFVIVFLVLPAMQVQAASYTVKSGDSLYIISKKTNVRIDALMQANQLTSTRIQPGQKLLIPESGQRPQAQTATTGATTYTVKKGDTLSAIAIRFGIRVEEIMSLNNVSPNNLRIGQKLVLARSPEAGNSEEDEWLEEDALVLIADATDATEPDLARQEFLGVWDSLSDRQRLVKVATGFLGAPYKLGGSSVRGIDCSAFVRMMYEIFDVTLPRTAHEQSRVGVRVDPNDLIEGDLVFFRTKKPIGHVGIYIGNNEFVHASYQAKAVRVDRLDQPYFQTRFRHAVRLKNLEPTPTGT